MEVVNVDDALEVANPPAHRGDLRVRRGALEQDVGGFPDAAHHADDNDHCDENGEHRIEPRDPAHEDEQAAERDGESAEHVAGDVKQRGLHVDVLARGARQRQADREVGHEADRREQRHQTARR